MEAVRSLIAKRLQYEMKRKKVSSDALSLASGLESSVISVYLSAETEIKFDELQKICDALKCNMLYLISQDYEETKLDYRITGGKAESLVSDIENITKLFIDLIKKPKKEKRKFKATDSDTAMILAEIEEQVKYFREHYDSIEKLYKEYSLPVIFIKAGSNKDSFDSFLLTIGEKSIVYVNQEKSLERVYFSLLHEFAHFLYHKNENIPVTFVPSDLYKDKVKNENLPEYFANKFAQLYLIPFKKSEEIYKKIIREQKLSDSLIKDLQQYIDDKKISKQVLNWSLKDYFIMHKQNQTILAELERKLSNNKVENNKLEEFLENEKREIERVIYQKKQEFSDKAISKMKELLGFAL